MQITVSENIYTGVWNLLDVTSKTLRADGVKVPEQILFRSFSSQV